MDQQFKPADETLAELVAARRDEVVRIQTASDNLMDTEARGQSRLTALRRSLTRELADTLDGLQDEHDTAAERAASTASELRARYAETGPDSLGETALHPGLVAGHLIAPNSLGWFTPYYATIHWSDGTVVWQGYNPGNLDAWLSSAGAGSGIFGTGAASGTLVVDWWFTYVPTEDRNYAHTIYVPYHGFYIVVADDGFWDSKEASIRIDLSAVGYQYNYKPPVSTNVLDVGDDNINVNDRFDGWRTQYYSDLLGADRAYLRVSTSLHTYARGGGSVAEINFSDGAANYIGVPWVYIN